MDLKQRKQILNGALPKFSEGTLLDQAQSITTAQGMQSIHPSNIVPTDITTDIMNADIASKVKPAGGAGSFLKNNAGGVMNIASTGLDFINTLGSVSKNTMTSDEMMGSGRQSNENANGVSYQQSAVDAAGIQSKIDATARAGTMASMGKGAAFGSAVGSVIPGLGTVAGGLIGGAVGLVGGLFGSSKARREAERQKRIAIDRTNASNVNNRELAYTIGLRNTFNRENRTDTSQSLFHAKEGTKQYKLNPFNGETLSWHKVNTSHGPILGPGNAYTNRNERIISNDGWSYKVKNGKHDDALTYLKPGDAVISAEDDMINPSTGNKIIDDADAIANANGGFIDRKDKNWLEMNQDVGRMMKYAGKRKGNLLPGYLGGTSFWGKAWNTIGNGLGNVRDAVNQLGNTIDIGNVATLGNAYLTAAQRDARAQGLRAPKSFVANPYEQDALQQLNNLHSDYYPIWSQNRELEGRGKSSIAQSGGLSAGQKMLGYMGLANQTQLNNMQALFEHQGRENALLSQAAKTSLETGNQTATRQQQGGQWDEDMLAKAHAGQDNKFEASGYDKQNALLSFYDNKFKKDQFDQTMDLYRGNQKIEKGKLDALLEHLGTKQNPEVAKATIAPQTVAQMKKMWNISPGEVDLGELELPNEVVVKPTKRVAKRRIVKRGKK